jgi:hypothetical protein
MPVNENIPLEEQLKQLGFSKAIKDVRMFTTIKSYEFTIPQSKKVDNDKLLCQLQFENAGNETKLKNYRLMVQSVSIPKWELGRINLEKLEKQLIKVDKFYDEYYLNDKQANDKQIKEIELAEKDILYLYDGGGVATQMAQLLMFKYWPEDKYRQYIPNLERFNENYQREITFEWSNGNLLTADEAYLKGKEKFYMTESGISRRNTIADGLLEEAQREITFGKEWMVYNTVASSLDRANVSFLKTKDEAIDFKLDNISEFDKYSFIQVKSVADLMTKIPNSYQPEYLLGIDPDENPLHNKDGNVFTDALIDHFEAQQSLLNKQLNTNVMNNDNLKYLMDNIKYMGFGEKLNTDLEQKMQEGKSDFQLTASVEFNKKSFEATLNFRKSDSTDMYFFNNYHASLEKNNGNKVEHTFYLNKGKGVTAKEAFNLLDGRAVYKDLVTKDGAEYKAWLQLDFETRKDKGFEVKQFHENYGYDLKEAVSKFAVAELKDPEKEKALMTSLQKGNIQSVTIEKDGESHKMFMEANPQYKNVTLYDSNMKMVAKESIERYQAVSNTAGKAVKEELETGKKKDLKQETKPGQEKKNDKTLLPKKRESTRKGLGVS